MDTDIRRVALRALSVTVGSLATQARIGGHAQRHRARWVEFDDDGTERVVSQGDWADRLQADNRTPRTGHRRLRLEFQRSRGRPAPWIDVLTRTTEGHLLRLRLKRGEIGGLPVPSQIEVRPVAGSVSMRTLGLTRILADINQALAKSRVADAVGWAWMPGHKRPGRAGQDDLEYAKKANMYVEAMRQTPRTPVRWLIEQAKREGRFETEGSWRHYILVARERGLLTKTSPGRAAGRLTRKAIAILREAGVAVSEEDM